MDLEKPLSLGSIATRVISTLVGVLLLYILSVGPACYIAAKTGRGGPLIETLYTPLVWAVQRTPLIDPMTAYVEFWLRLAGTPRVMP